MTPKGSSPGTPLSTTGGPQKFGVFVTQGLLPEVFKAAVISRQNQMPAPASITRHHPLRSLQITVQTITQVKLGTTLIMQRKCVKDIE